MRMTEDEYKGWMLKHATQVKPVWEAKTLKEYSDMLEAPKPLQNERQTLKQTKIETEYGRMLTLEFPDCTVEPFAITFRLQNGHKYTPDYVVKNKTGIKLIVEVKARGKGKNGFRQPSYQRSKVMFDQTRVEYPFWEYRFAEKHNGVWNESHRKGQQ